MKKGIAPYPLFAALLAYLLLALVMTYPWVLHLSTHTPDGGGEASTGLWNLWHFRYALAQGSPFTTRLQAPPFTLNLVFHVYTVSRDLLALPLLPWLGLVPASNWLLLASFGLAGVGAWLVAFDVTGDSGAAFVAGLIYTFAPYRFAHLTGHYNLATLEWIPFYAFFACRYLRGGQPLYLGLAALAALATSLTDYNYGLYLGLWTLLVGAVWLIGRGGRLGIARLAWLAGLVVLVHVPLLALMRWAVQQGAWVARPTGVGQLETFSADLAAFLTPSQEHPLWGPWAKTISSGFRANFAEGTVFLGWLPLLLALVATAAFARWKLEGRLWVLAFWGFGLLALGPSLQWRGRGLFPLPARWLAEAPIWRELRIPSRFTVMVMLALGVLCALALAWLLGPAAPHERQVLRRWALPLAALLVLFEYLPAPLGLSDRTLPAVYRSIATDPAAPPGAGAVLDLPVGVNDGFTGLGGWNPLALYHQTVTGRPFVGAHIARIPSAVFQAYAAMPIISRLAQLDHGGASTVTGADVAADRRAVNQVAAYLDLRYIAAPAWYRERPGFAYLQQVFGGCLEPLPGDDAAVGYRVMRPCP